MDTKHAVFLSDRVELVGRKLRHVTGATLLLLEETRNPLLIAKFDDALPLLSAQDLVQAVTQYIYLHSRSAADALAMQDKPDQLTAEMREIADALPVASLVDIAKELNAHIHALHATRDWEVAGQSGGPFTHPVGQLSTSPSSPS
jgi:hypothetical protein